MNNDIIGKNIRKFRELKGFSQEYMAHEMDITQASYAKLENNSTQINVERLFTIARLLETDVADILELNKQTIFNQSNNVTANAFGNVDKLYQDNKELTEQLIKAKDELIFQLQKEIEMLKSKK